MRCMRCCRYEICVFLHVNLVSVLKVQKTQHYMYLGKSRDFCTSHNCCCTYQHSKQASGSYRFEKICFTYVLCGLLWCCELFSTYIVGTVTRVSGKAPMYGSRYF
jgi:hypothetical protein